MGHGGCGVLGAYSCRGSPAIGFAASLRIFGILTVAALTLCLVPGVALANFGIHGGYSMESHACAGCHRAHTAASSIMWSDSQGAQRRALLLGTEVRLCQYCTSCHGSAAAGAATNVVDGVYEADGHGTLGGSLNGGAFGADVVGENHHNCDDGSARPLAGRTRSS